MAANVSERNTLNALTGAQWLYGTKSILITSYAKELGHDVRKEHGANKPPRLMCQLVEFFTKPGECVLDPFAGVGGTLIGASITSSPRKAIGIELNPRWIEIYQRVVTEICPDLAPQTMLQGDCLQIMPTFPATSFDFITMDPPYNIQMKQTMSNGRSAKQFSNRRSNYNMKSDDSADLANLTSYEDYLDAMESVFAACFTLLKPQKYMVIIVRNAYQRSEYIFTHVDLARRAKLHGFVPKGEIIWYQAGTRLRPYGYPTAFVPNIAHQYILILQRRV